MAKIKADTRWQKKFSAQLNISFASAVQNNNSVVQAMDAKSVLTKKDANTDLGGAISNIMNTLGSSVDAFTGTKVNNNDVTNITNIFNTHFKNKTYSTNDVQNIINNINKNTVVINTTQGCNLDATALNSAVFDNCDFNNNILILNQSASVKSLQSCSQGVVNQMLTANTGLIAALDTASLNSANNNLVTTSNNNTGIIKNTLSNSANNKLVTTSNNNTGIIKNTLSNSANNKLVTTSNNNTGIIKTNSAIFLTKEEKNTGIIPKYIDIGGDGAEPLKYRMDDIKMKDQDIKDKKTLTIIIIITIIIGLILALAIILIKSNKATKMSAPPEYQLTATPAMQTKM